MNTYNKYLQEALNVLKGINLDEIAPEYNIKGLDELREFINNRGK